MGLFDEIKKLTRPYEDEEDDFDEPEAAAPAAAPSYSTYTAPVAEPKAAPRAQVRKDGSKVVNIGASGSQMQVVLVKPEKFETAAEIADHLRERRAVLMNLEATPKDVTRRLIDFLSGVAYAQDGRIKKVASATYIITPANINLVGDLMDEIETSATYF